MTKRITERRGASMVLALFAFVIVSMVSMVIVNAALTNAARIERQSEQEQAYLTAMSTAAVLKEWILATGEDSRKYIYVNRTGTRYDTNYYIGDQAQATEDGNGDASQGAVVNDPKAAFPQTIGAMLNDMMKRKLNAKNDTGLQPPDDRVEMDTLTIQSKDSADTRFGKVTVTFTTDNTKSPTFEARIVVKGDDNADVYAMEMKFIGRAIKEGDRSYSYYVWDQARITKAAVPATNVAAPTAGTGGE